MAGKLRASKEHVLQKSLELLGVFSRSGVGWGVWAVLQTPVSTLVSGLEGDGCEVPFRQCLVREMHVPKVLQTMRIICAGTV